MKRSSAILKLLSNKTHISGTKLGDKLEIGRAAIQKHILTLKNQGISITSTKGKGYILDHPLYLLNESYLNQHLPIAVEVVESIDSTNAALLKRKEPLLLLAESQLAGKGRQGQDWIDSGWQNIALSLGFRMKQWHKHLGALSLVVGSRLLQSLQSFGVQDAGVKWPNDILLQHKKIGGILIEATGDCNGECFMAIGVGINCHLNTDNKKLIDQPSISLSEAGYDIDRNLLVQHFIASLLEDLSLFEQQGFAPFMQLYNSLHLWQGKKVVTTNPHLEGIALGADNTGALIIETLSGKRHFIQSASTSIRLHSSENMLK